MPCMDERASGRFEVDQLSAVGVIGVSRGGCLSASLDVVCYPLPPVQHNILTPFVQRNPAPKSFIQYVYFFTLTSHTQSHQTAPLLPVTIHQPHSKHGIFTLSAFRLRYSHSFPNWIPEGVEDEGHSGCVCGMGECEWWFQDQVDRRHQSSHRFRRCHCR